MNRIVLYVIIVFTLHNNKCLSTAHAFPAVVSAMRDLSHSYLQPLFDLLVQENVWQSLFLRLFINFIVIENKRIMIENEKFEEPLGVDERIRRLKHWLVFITFGVPMFFSLLNLLIWVNFLHYKSDCKKARISLYISSHQNGLTSIRIRFPFNSFGIRLCPSQVHCKKKQKVIYWHTMLI